MATNFPVSDDVFDVPSDPVNTPLNSAGDGSRTHSEHHRDLGDAIVAMQAEATYKAHSHDGVTFRHGEKLLQANTHQSVDTDSSTSAIHHTIGSGANQYASGTHTHGAVATYPIGAFFLAAVSTYPGVTDPVTFLPGLGLSGVWTSVGDRFLCASGGALGFAPGSTGGSNSHTHTIDASTNSQAAHNHSLASATISSVASHTHTTNGVSSTSKSHTHSMADTGDTGTHQVATGDAAGGSSTLTHTHTSQSSSTSHSHSSPTSGSSGGHSHSLTSTTLGNSTSHSHTNSSPASANNLIPLFVVYMWKRTA